MDNDDERMARAEAWAAAADEEDEDEDGDAESKEEEQARVSTLFVGNLPFDATTESVRAHFNADDESDVIDVEIKLDDKTQR
jgi:RNA recognition motif-containing protein